MALVVLLSSSFDEVRLMGLETLVVDRLFVGSVDVSACGLIDAFGSGLVDVRTAVA